MANLTDFSKITTKQETSFEEWESYVISHPSGTIYHLPQWKEALEKSFHYKPYYLSARDENDKLCGIFPLFQIKSWLTGNRLVSLPFSHICGPIADSDQVLVTLINEAKKLCHTLRCHYIEIRMRENDKGAGTGIPRREVGLKVSEHFSTHMLSLSQPDIVWKEPDPSIRRAVRKARKDGVVIRKSDCAEGLRCFYKLNLKTKRKLGVPAHPFTFLFNIYEKLNGLATLYLAEFEGKVIAGIIMMEFKDTVVYAYGASDDNYLVHRPNNLLIWTAIEGACQQGYKFFDFGRTSSAEQGLAAFKKRWGAQERNLAYYYYPHIPSSMALNETGLKYRLATSLWKRLPLPLAHWGSNRVFKHLG